MSKNVNNDVCKDPPIPFYSRQLLGDLAYQYSEARGDLALIQTSLLLLALESLDLHNKSSELCIKTRSLSAPLSFRGQVTEQTTVKWSITVGSTKDQL